MPSLQITLPWHNVIFDFLYVVNVMDYGASNQHNRGLKLQQTAQAQNQVSTIDTRLLTLNKPRSAQVAKAWSAKYQKPLQTAVEQNHYRQLVDKSLF